MAAPSRKLADPPYQPLPSVSDDHYGPDYVLLPVYIPAVVRRRWRCRLFSAASIVLLVFAVYLLWPSDPDLKVVRLRLQRARIHTLPRISLDIKLDVTIRVRNRDFYSLDYRSLVVAIGYRGKKLGFVTADQGHVRARGSSYIDAKLELDGVEILSDVFFLLEDLAKGSIPFDTVTEINGRLGLLFFKIPLEAKVSCEVNINTHNQSIIRQNCYPE